MSLINFESSRQIDKKRQDIREARQSVLEKAKDKYERDEQRKELAKQRGEDTWILPSVEQRLEQEKKELKQSKSKKKKEEKKKKKHKEKKKKKKESSSDSSSEEEDNEMQWVVKGSEMKTEKPAVKGPKLERESWMEAPLDLVPTISRQDLISKRKQEEEELKKQKALLDQPGQHEKELNPYWKDGGTGLPEQERSEVKSSAKSAGVGDSGLTWLRKSYQRCVEQAREEGRSLEQLAAERWGSLEKIQEMIKEAEAVSSQGHRRKERYLDSSDNRRDRFMRPGDQKHDYKQSKLRSRSRSRSPNRKYSYRRNSPMDRRSHRHSRSRSRERYRRSRSRSPFENAHKRDRQRKSRSRSRDKQRSRSKEKDRNRRRSRSRSNDRTKTYNASSSGSSLKSRFLKPGELNNDDSHNQRSYSKSGHVPAWKKKEFQKPVERNDTKKDEDEKREEKSGESDTKERRRHRERRRKSSSSSSSDSSSATSSSEESDADEDHGSRSQESEVSVKVLTEKEMNELGAKILRAEIMGNQALAEKLKSQMEAARKAAEIQKASGTVPQAREQGRKQDEEDDFVMLTRTDKSGVTRPVPEQKHPREAKGGRRKKQKVETHTGSKGERTKYFDDDDKFDLKTMVEREKLGTAEDQNQMFARLAGRAAEKTNDDFQIDDVFLSKANRKQSESIQEERNRAQAIFEHKKMASALEKCQFCFGNVPKHLIVAIGTKSYLCLPNNKSLTEGHCLIVPMTHVASGTACDEDVWNEIQVFRKTLTRMFSERDEDVVFMETSMRLKHFPHMSLECIPMDKEVGDLAPIYFKKAIQECETEWSQNKKVVDISQKDIRHAVPKGFPYFAVDFGNQGGFAHVIEDEQRFPWHFGREIIGGMIDADHKLWRKPNKENFDEQRKKVMKFAEMWKPYDWTQHIARNDSDSD